MCQSCKEHWLLIACYLLNDVLWIFSAQLWLGKYTLQCHYIQTKPTEHSNERLLFYSYSLSLSNVEASWFF